MTNVIICIHRQMM